MKKTKTQDRPCCATCGKPAAKKSEPIFFEKPLPRNRQEAQARTNKIILTLRRHYVGEGIGTANVWDGETYVTPFCTDRCAVIFARAAFASGFRFKEPIKMR
jgi:endogenous inhibitor of DNA gyrase (YacG/DUF329 family)